ncbi:thiamine diphosphokinase [Paraliobacillus ryukyuensis]|uniref:thiamine diphosphokinase n=1 Tax=Paraliobacillus ryukyuensis TaxID=200904 RepID=UPI0021191B05|nr:thiamine diphosphokinase [Paraliobacillus ryukyuensis]
MNQQIKTIGIVAGGPNVLAADLKMYDEMVDSWIGADEGCSALLHQNLSIDLAIGDFDSISEENVLIVSQKAKEMIRYPVEKDETDLELAIEHAVALAPNRVLLFGVTGGRMDHTLANVQQLIRFSQVEIHATIIDQQNTIQLYKPGEYQVIKDNTYSNVSFLSFSEKVTGLSLKGFYYPLNDYSLSWGSTRCLSNKLLSKKGTFSFTSGILIMIKSRDVLLT